jgi:hypothetical protein
MDAGCVEARVFAPQKLGVEKRQGRRFAGPPRMAAVKILRVCFANPEPKNSMDAVFGQRKG